MTKPSLLELADEPWSETIRKLREVKTDAEIEVELCASQFTISKWVAGKSKPRPSAQRSLRKMIAEWLSEGAPALEIPQAQFVADQLAEALRERNIGRAEAILFVNRLLIHEALEAFAAAALRATEHHHD